jgi:hypothetical protein
MNLKDKNVFIVIGASRTGKGTLLQALTGTKMSLFKKKNVVGTELEKDMALATNVVMAPVDANGTPLVNRIISHAANSHTLKPKFVNDPPVYPDEFTGLDGWHAVDFPGMFESKGPELDTALYLALQKILLEANQAKVMVLVSAHFFVSESNHILTTINEKLNVMFKEPEKHTIIGIVKTSFVTETLGEQEDVMSCACGEDGEEISFKPWAQPFPDKKNVKHIMVVEQDNQVQLQELVMAIQSLKPIRRYVKRGFLNEYEVKKMFELKETKKGIQKMHVTMWIEMLVNAIEDRVKKPPETIDLIIEKINEVMK